ncbi:hypothetical protein Tco_0566779 [Tanacetum coccineum]
MHDDFVAGVYPQVHESLKHPYEEHVHLENPLSSTGTLSSMKYLDNFTFGDQFIADKSPEDELRNANMETKVESMVTAPIYQALSYVPPLSTPVIDLTPLKPVSDLSEADIKEILHQWMFDSSSYKSHPIHKALYEALEDSDASGSKQTPAQTSSAWKTSDIREAPFSSSKQKTVPQSEQQVDDIPIPDVEHILDSEDTCVAHLPKIKTRPDWLKPIPEEDRPETLEPD